jgi:hypothetical protein
MANTVVPRQPLNNLAPFQIQGPEEDSPLIVEQVFVGELVFADGSSQTTAGGGSLPSAIDSGTY